eukprot:Blabericola_migrator_1__3074@NODE_1898_length_3592_cov_148_977872_g1215_i0_p2_GENE_NODE_1898_length_3592_cov_148_977872_g1215_i0NODE_1898_length_3592_cov_148_977872_g1215_i0_p2_ORF_typecomplete_len159_score39_46Ribosomal_L24e/PF01246_20/3_1e16Ribosomal_L24e/PF01246_20/1_1e04AAA_23/PF13476_6/0_38MTBP_C/PF14920_6/1_1_NODE_1898_length_3592_cov_148_977872_g1215_i011281604
MQFVRNDGRLFTYCSSKCKSHFKARHNPKRSKWTKAHRIAAGKELTIDSVFQFEKRRNVPIKYNRDLYIKTIKAMKRIDEIRQKRRARFYQMRMRVAQDRLLAPNKQLLAKESSQRLLEVHQREKERRERNKELRKQKLLEQRAQREVAKQVELVEMN